jgi:hypothetical protein
MMPATNPDSPVPNTDCSHADGADHQAFAIAPAPSAVAHNGYALPAPVAGGETTPGGTESASPATNQAVRRALKLVLTLQPDDVGGYRALLAFGADGCDPLFRRAVAPSLEVALGEIAALVTEAEERWRHQPRNPGVAVPQVHAGAVRARSSGTAQSASAAEAVKPDGASETESVVAPLPALSDVRPALKSPATGQLSLFG